MKILNTKFYSTGSCFLEVSRGSWTVKAEVIYAIWVKIVINQPSKKEQIRERMMVSKDGRTLTG